MEPARSYVGYTSGPGPDEFGHGFFSGRPLQILCVFIAGNRLKNSQLLPSLYVGGCRFASFISQKVS